MSRGIDNNDNNFIKPFLNGFLLENEMIKALIQMADLQYSIYLRFMDLTNGNTEEAEKQTFIFMKALNAGNRKQSDEK